jgi:hypothetical protein
MGEVEETGSSVRHIAPRDRVIPFNISEQNPDV